VENKLIQLTQDELKGLFIISSETLTEGKDYLLEIAYLEDYKQI
jgi:hypothetical protein